MFLNEIFPNKCISCGKSIPFYDFICVECKEKLFDPSITVLNNTIIYHSAFYEGTMKKIIQEFKFHEKIYYTDFLSRMLLKTYKYFKLEFSQEPEILYIPSIKRHYKIRGYNPVEEIAKKFSKYTGFKINHALSVKKGYNKSQVEAKTIEERKKQIKGKFILTGELEEKDYILIDDVYTTGATIEEVLNILKSKITVITLCKNVKK